MANGLIFRFGFQLNHHSKMNNLPIPILHLIYANLPFNSLVYNVRHVSGYHYRRVREYLVSITLISFANQQSSVHLSPTITHLQTNTTHQFVRPAVVPAPHNNTILRFPVNTNYDVSAFTAFWIVIKIHGEEMVWVANGNHFAASIIAIHVHTLQLAIHTSIFRASVAALTMIRNDIPVIMNFTRNAQTPSGEWHLNSILLSTNDIFRQ